LGAADDVLRSGQTIAHQPGIEGDGEIRDGRVGVSQQPLEGSGALDQITDRDVFVDDVADHERQERCWVRQVGPARRPLLQ
jgi:hypothetical protein